MKVYLTPKLLGTDSSGKWSLETIKNRELLKILKSKRNSQNQKNEKDYFNCISYVWNIDELLFSRYNNKEKW